jgi:hypothetical protein
MLGQSPTVLFIALPSLMKETGGGKKLVYRTSYRIKNGPLPSVHAEHAMIEYYISKMRARGLNQGRKKLSMFVARVNRCGEFGKSRPCRDCILRLLKCGLPIKHIYYTDVVDNNVVVRCEELSEGMFKSEQTQFSGYVKMRQRDNVKKMKN